MADNELKTPTKSALSRRDFLRLMGAAGVGLAFAPFVPFGNFMPNPTMASLEKAPVILPDGTQANINSYPVNHSEVITYPSTGDTSLDSEAFRKWQFIRLPKEFGGEKDEISSFRVFSMICLHLWCLWDYQGEVPINPRSVGSCPCHGSEYNIKTGTAYKGPASVQAAPSNTLAKLDLEADSDGYLWIKIPTLTVNENGIIGYGRFV